MKRILITGAGGDVAAGIVKCILSDMPEARLFSCDIKGVVPYLDRFEKHFVVPRYDSDVYWAVIERICIEYNITHFFPTTEPEILISDKHREFFAENNIIPVINNSHILDIATSKTKTAAFLRENSICTPVTYHPNNLPDKPDFPYIVKPDFGRGSAHIAVVNNNRELKDALTAVPNPIIQKHIGSAEHEYTVGVFSDGQNTRSISFRRTLGRGGMSVFVEVVDDSRLDGIAQSVARLFGLKGCINIQLRSENDKYYVFEINPRVSSTAAFRHQMGFKDAIWWLQMLDGEAIGDYVKPEIGTIGIKLDDEQIFRPPLSNVVRL